jgi:hypothetical protein
MEPRNLCAGAIRSHTQEHIDINTNVHSLVPEGR